MGRVALLVRNPDEGAVLKTAEGHDKSEFIITRHSNFEVPINVIVYYGNQESRSNVEEIDQNWNEIMKEVIKIEERQEGLIWVGDFNRQIGDIVKGNKKKVSHGGSLIRDLIESDKYVLLNGSSKVKNGPWTRYDPSSPDDNERKSALDLAIVS